MVFYFKLLLFFVLCVSRNACASCDLFEPNVFKGKNSGIQELRHDFRGPQFRLLTGTDKDGFFLVGTRNSILNVSATDINKVSRINFWTSDEEDRNHCYLKGKNTEQCQNFMRLFIRDTERNFVLACGTNAFRPLCRKYTIKYDDGHFEEGDVFYDSGGGGGGNSSIDDNVGRRGGLLYLKKQDELNGFALCPFGPRDDYTFVYTDGEIFAATHYNFEGTLSAIYRKPLMTDHFNDGAPKTPVFLHSFRYGAFVYFLYREKITPHKHEHEENAVIARVAVHDTGNKKNRRNGLAFLKDNCSVL